MQAIIAAPTSNQITTGRSALFTAGAKLPVARRADRHACEKRTSWFYQPVDDVAA
jgi:hypothetical protein